MEIQVLQLYKEYLCYGDRYLDYIKNTFVIEIDTFIIHRIPVL